MAKTSLLAEPIAPVPVPAQGTDADLFVSDPLLSAVGIGKDLWAEDYADEYIARLRKDW